MREVRLTVSVIVDVDDPCATDIAARMAARDIRGLVVTARRNPRPVAESVSGDPGDAPEETR